MNAAEYFGLPRLSAYLDSVESSFQHGANFATGGATIRRQNESWFLNGVSPFPLEIQTAQFNQFKARTTYLYNSQGMVIVFVKMIISFIIFSLHQFQFINVDKKIYKTRLPRPKDFSNALYVFDIGQNDLADGFRNLNYDHIKRMKPSIPDIVDRLADAIQVSRVIMILE